MCRTNLIVILLILRIKQLSYNTVFLNKGYLHIGHSLGKQLLQPRLLLHPRRYLKRLKTAAVHKDIAAHLCQCRSKSECMQMLAVITRQTSKLSDRIRQKDLLQIISVKLPVSSFGSFITALRSRRVRKAVISDLRQRSTIHHIRQCDNRAVPIAPKKRDPLFVLFNI